MGRARTIARRTFLIGSAAIAGGVAFGTYLYKSPIENPLIDGLGEDETAITPYVLINQEGITLITPQADVGQGAYSVQAALIAEELDVSLDQIKVAPGRPGPAYYSGEPMAEVLPFAATDEGILAQSNRTLSNVTGKLLGLQATGASTTVALSYERLRTAGAIARETILLAAAKTSGVPRDQLKSENGRVLLPDGSSLSYVELAGQAAKIEPPDEVELRSPDDWRHLGKSMRRVDIVAKSTGAQTYGIDLMFPDMVYATVRTNPGMGGGMNGFDASRAEKMRGVKKIVPIANGVGVIADNTWRAFQAADAIEFDWAPAPYPASSDEMWGRFESAFVEDNREIRFKDDGDVDAAVDGPNVIEAEYRVPFLAHAPLEPMSVVILLTDERLDIWTGTQIPTFVCWNAASMTGLNGDQIHLHVQMSGGSFGRRLEDDYIQQAIELAQSLKGTPIKLTWTREEDMTHDFPRTMELSRARGSFKDGKVDSLDLSIASLSTMESQLGRQMKQYFGSGGIPMPLPSPDITIVAGAWDQPLSIPNYRVSGYRVPKMVPVSSWRSVGASGNAFLHDAFLDELIHAAGADPLEERIRLCWHETSRKVLETVGEMAGWGGELDENQGRGVAFCMSFGVPVAEVVEVTNTERGIRIDKVFVAADVGRVIDPVNFEAQVQGGVIWGLGHAMNCELTYEDGLPLQTNYHAYEGMRLYQCPEIMVRGLENGEKVRGIGEPPVPPAAPALANAIFAATGKRIRELPLNRHIDFV